MKIRADLTPPFREVDPDDVVVERVGRDDVLGGLEAYGYLRSEMTFDDNDDVLVVSARTGYKSVRMIPGREYRIAYMDDLGRWQAEGTIRRESPPAQVLAQIELKLMELEAEARARSHR